VDKKKRRGKRTGAKERTQTRAQGDKTARRECTKRDKTACGAGDERDARIEANRVLREEWGRSRGKEYSRKALSRALAREITKKINRVAATAAGEQ